MKQRLFANLWGQRLRQRTSAGRSLSCARLWDSFASMKQYFAIFLVIVCHLAVFGQFSPFDRGTVQANYLSLSKTNYLNFEGRLRIVTDIPFEFSFAGLTVDLNEFNEYGFTWYSATSYLIAYIGEKTDIDFIKIFSGCLIIPYAVLNPKVCFGNDKLQVFAFNRFDPFIWKKNRLQFLPGIGILKPFDKISIEAGFGYLIQLNFPRSDRKTSSPSFCIGLCYVLE